MDRPRPQLENGAEQLANAPALPLSYAPAGGGGGNSRLVFNEPKHRSASCYARPHRGRVSARDGHGGGPKLSGLAVGKSTCANFVKNSKVWAYRSPQPTRYFMSLM